MKSNIDPLTILECARSLASEDGENSEYDRALVELTTDLIPGLTMDDKPVVAQLIGVKGDFG